MQSQLREIQSSSFGGLVGMGVAALLYKYNTAFFDGLTDRVYFIIYGGAFGSVVSRNVGSILSSLSRITSCGEKRLEAQVTFRVRLWTGRNSKE